MVGRTPAVHSKMNLDTLPDDELLLVLGFLEARDLLRCRGVCRRLRDTALHPHLWRQIYLSCSDGLGLCAAVLRLAPCLGTLYLYSSSLDVEVLRLVSLLVSTNCAISNLCADLVPRCAVLLATALTRQVALGRLEYVTLGLDTTEKTPEFRLLLDELLHIPGLTGVAVNCYPDGDVPLELSLPKAAQEDSVPASLRRLEMDFKDSTLPLYLKWHADTLEEVKLQLSEYPDGTAALLRSLPHLEELKCSIMDDMPTLLQCPALKTLYLSVDVNNTTRPFLHGVRKYLRQAVVDQLETLTMQFEEEGSWTTEETRVCASANNLMLSLAGPGSSAPPALRSLSLAYADGTPSVAELTQPQLLPLASVLPRLEHLVSLDLGGPPTLHFLEAMDGRVLPRLERLRIHIRDRCAHEWVHGAEPRDLLRRYPLLHLEVSSYHIGACHHCDNVGCDHCKCDFCEKNSCHDYKETTVHTLFTHPEQEVCNQKHGYAGFRIVW